jgi:beta-glucosidase
MVLRIVAAWYQMGQDSSDYQRPNFSSWFRTPKGPRYFGSNNEGRKELELRNSYQDVRSKHHELARQVAAEGIVLLKNFGSTLPFKTGDEARKAMVVFGSGAAGNPLGMNSCVDRGCNSGTLGTCLLLGPRDYC